MNLTAVSVSYKTADVSFRERIAFTRKRQTEILKHILENKYAIGCVLISTCNRTELYLDGCTDSFFEYFYGLVGADAEEVRTHMSVYRQNEAVIHLFELAAGLDSMVLGEDQILGQVRDAHELSLSEKTSSQCLNILFRLAVTSAKKIKTDTALSKTSVSVASLAIKACGEYLGGLRGKNVLVIGAGGRIGSIVVKDLLSIGGVNVYVTTRTHPPVQGACIRDEVNVVNYENRYEYAEIADAVISATSSPHYVLKTCLIPCTKRRIFADLAVPKDIDAENDGNFCYINIDDFQKIAQRNNEKKLTEAQKARIIIKKYAEEFYTRRVMTDNRKMLEEVYKKITEKFGSDAVKPIKYTLYKVKSCCTADELAEFIHCLEASFGIDFTEGFGR